MVDGPSAFSLPQRIIHWGMVLLIGFNLLFADGMSSWGHLVRRGETPTADQVASANIHAYVGIAILGLAALRLMLRLVQGAPEEPPGEPPLLKLASKISHVAFYALFFAMPLSGIAAYYFGAQAVGSIHSGPLKMLMWVLIGIHVAAALLHQFYWRTDVMKRMTTG